jgi:hypothetical protein
MCSKECVERIENLFRECFHSVLLAVAVSAQLNPDSSASNAIPSTSSSSNNPITQTIETLLPSMTSNTESPQAALQNIVSRLISTPHIKTSRKRHRKRKSRAVKHHEALKNEEVSKEGNDISKESRYPPLFHVIFLSLMHFQFLSKTHTWFHLFLPLCTVFEKLTNWQSLAVTGMTN